MRNLTPGELLGQIIAVNGHLHETDGPDARISNVVLMGSGEPLDNYDNVIKFLRLLNREDGLHMSLRGVSLSTCGLVPRIYDLANEGLPVTLCISLHAPNDEVRRRTMPIANKYAMDDILAACRNYIDKTGRRVIFEYALVSGVNCSRESAHELAARLRGMQCHVNLIPLNDVPERDLRAPVRARSMQSAISVSRPPPMERLSMRPAAPRVQQQRARSGRGGCPMKCYAITHKGTRARATGTRRSENFALVCDGMGGHLAGEVASRTAIDSMRRSLDGANPDQEMLREAIREANIDVYRLAQDKPEYTGMGTTLTAIWWTDEKVLMGHVGDSRLYKFEGGKLTHLSHDHTRMCRSWSIWAKSAGRGASRTPGAI